MKLIINILSFIGSIFIGTLIMVLIMAPLAIIRAFYEKEPIYGILCIFFIIWICSWIYSKTPAYKEYDARYNLINRINSLSDEDIKKYLEILSGTKNKEDIVDILLSRKNLFDKEFVQEYISKVYMDVTSLVEKHLKTLRIKEKQKTVYDDYGINDDSLFISELKYFSKKVLLSGEDYSSDIIEKYTKIAFIEYKYLKSKTTEENLSPSFDFDDVKTGEDYENFIFDILSNNGFIARKTPHTGDQGVDILVDAGERRIAIQCKLYSRPVGNKAVQEVSAGKEFYNCDLAIVVSNNSYTTSARRLAENLDVHLCHHETILDTIRHLTS